MEWEAGYIGFLGSGTFQGGDFQVVIGEVLSPELRASPGTGGFSS